MKSKEEIKLMGESYATTHEDVSDRLGKYLVSACFQDGYTQCQEDMTKELEELRESIRKNTWYDEDGDAQVNLYGINNNLLNKQD